MDPACGQKVRQVSEYTRVCDPLLWSHLPVGLLPYSYLCCPEGEREVSLARVLLAAFLLLHFSVLGKPKGIGAQELGSERKEMVFDQRPVQSLSAKGATRPTHLQAQRPGLCVWPVGAGV